ncbi:MAG: hypothetical protein AB7P40_19065 [Chloroflexota bacterium]
MVLTPKEAARQLIDALPDDVSLDDIMRAMSRHEQSEPSQKDAESESVPRRLVRKGHVMVLEPVRPVPTVTVEMVNDLIDEMRSEREDRWLGPVEDGQG